MDPIFLGIEIGGTKLQIAAGDGSGKIQHRWRHTVNPGHGGQGIRVQIQQTLPEIKSQFPVLGGVGVGFGGPVDWQSGTIACSHQIEGWSGFGLRDWLQALAQVPVRIDNDANTAALGEAKFGAGINHNPVFYITLGSGVGGGLVINGQIYHGMKPGEAEIGHVRLDRSGATVESRCSGWAVDAKIRQFNAAHPTSLLAQLSASAAGSEARHLATACHQGDHAALQILRETAEDLAFALSHVAHLFHPEIIVLGGGLSLMGEPLRLAIAAALPSFIMQVFAPGPRVILAALGEDSVPAGALELARQASQG